MVTAHGAEELGLCPHGLACQAGENGFDLAGVTFARGRIYAGGIILKFSTAARTKITRVASNRALFDLYAECRSFAPTARASRKFKNKNKPLTQY